jgi:hypothetical protein
MWGNKQGWVISACIVLVMSWILWQIAGVEEVSGPSGAFPKLLAPIALPVDPATVVAKGEEPCDAGEKYRAALELYLQDPKHYDEKVFGHPREALNAVPEAVRHILDARGCGRMNLFASKPGEVVTYDNTPATAALQRLGQIVQQMGMILKNDAKPDEARQCFEAGFALGRHLYAERLAWEEFNVGVNLMHDAATQLSKMELAANNSRRAQELKEFAEKANAYKLEQVKLQRVLSSIAANDIARHAGDYFALARRSPETMWRTEAALSLGRLRFNSARVGDQRGATRELKLLQADPNAAVRTAATAASELTIERYRMLGN